MLSELFQYTHRTRGYRSITHLIAMFCFTQANSASPKSNLYSTENSGEPVFEPQVLVTISAKPHPAAKRPLMSKKMIGSFNVTA